MHLPTSIVVSTVAWNRPVDPNWGTELDMRESVWWLGF